MSKFLFFGLGIVAMMYTATNREPRGIRNNNPLNIERNSTQWLGMSPEQTDARFVVFDSPVYGIRAGARVLKTYETKYGLNTVEGIIARFAPSHENNTGAYVRHVAQALSVQVDEPFSVESRLVDLVSVMIQHENGVNPYTREIIAQGVALA